MLTIQKGILKEFLKNPKGIPKLILCHSIVLYRIVFRTMK